MSVTVTQQLTEQTVSVTGNPVENNVVVTVSNARGPEGPEGPSGASTWDDISGTASSIPFEPVTAPSYAEGLVFYDTDDKSLTYYNDEADAALNIGREMWVRVRNSTGSTITNGQVVYISGATGQLPTVSLAQANAANTSEVIGVATHDIENNSNGYVTVSGEVKGLDLSAYNDGDRLYLSAATAGGYTTTAPTAPNRVVQIGTVAHAHPSNGKLLAHPETQSVESTGIADSTATGRSLITAADADSARTALGLGTGDDVGFRTVNVSGVAPSNTPSAGIGLTSSNHLAIFANSTVRMIVISTGATIGSGADYAWSSLSTPTNATRDLVLARDAANTLAQRNGTGLNPQTFRLYNTYSSSTNFERLNFRWSGNTSYIGTEKGSGGGTARDLVLETDGTSRAKFAASENSIEIIGASSSIILASPNGTRWRVAVDNTGALTTTAL